MPAAGTISPKGVYTPGKGGEFPTPLAIDERPVLYLKRKSDEIARPVHEGIFNNWKKSMSEYFKDCDALVRKIKENKFDSMHMKEIVEYYNDICSD